MTAPDMPPRSSSPPTAPSAGAASSLRGLLLACRRQLDGVAIATALGVHPTTVYNWSAGRQAAGFRFQEPIPPRYRTGLIHLAVSHGILTPDATAFVCNLGVCPWTGSSWDSLQLHDATDHVPPAQEDDVLSDPYRTRAVVRAALELLEARARRYGRLPPSHDLLHPLRAALTVR